MMHIGKTDSLQGKSEMGNSLTEIAMLDDRLSQRTAIHGLTDLFIEARLELTSRTSTRWPGMSVMTIPIPSQGIPESGWT
jgi:hypothetical protein